MSNLLSRKRINEIYKIILLTYVYQQIIGATINADETGENRFGKRRGGAGMRLPHRRTKRRRNWALGDQQGEAGTHVAGRATLALCRSISSQRQLLSLAPAPALLRVFRENSRNSRCFQLKLCEVCAVLVLWVVHVAVWCDVARLCDIADFRAVPVVPHHGCDCLVSVWSAFTST